MTKHAEHPKGRDEPAPRSDKDAKEDERGEPCCEARFKVDQVGGGDHGLRSVVLSPVADAEENKVFFNCVANGSIQVMIQSPDTLTHFDEGGEFIVSFTKVKKVEVTKAETKPAKSDKDKE